jgi:hypothetical protein
MVGTNTYDDATWVAYAPVVYSAVHPDYDLPYNDAGILQLGDGGISGVGTIPLNTDRVSSSWVGEDITYVGYGISSDSGTGSGTKRTVDVPIYDYDSGIIITWDPAGGANICSGDSGGAALRPVGSGWELVGINSFGFMIDGSSRVLCDDPDAAAGVTRVDAVLPWLTEEMGGGGGSTGGGTTDGGSGSGAADGGDTGAPDATGDDAASIGQSTATVPEGESADSKGVGCASAGRRGSSSAVVGLALAAGAAALRLRRRAAHTAASGGAPS